MKFLYEFVDGANDDFNLILSKFFEHVKNNLSKSILQILNSIPLPNYANLEELHQFILNKSLEKLYKNEKIKEFLKNISENDYDILNILNGYNELIEDVIKDVFQDVDILFDMFLNSNFDYTDFTSLMQATIVICEKLELLRTKIKQASVKINKSIKSKRHNKFIVQLKHEEEQIFKDINKLVLQLSRIELYIDLFNSNSLFEVLEKKNYDKEKLNLQFFNDQINKLNDLIDENLVLNQTMALEKHSNDPTAKLFSDILELVR